MAAKAAYAAQQNPAYTLPGAFFAMERGGDEDPLPTLPQSGGGLFQLFRCFPSLVLGEGQGGGLFVSAFIACSGDSPKPMIRAQSEAKVTLWAASSASGHEVSLNGALRSGVRLTA